jgi:hypothetical protein
MNRSKAKKKTIISLTDTYFYFLENNIVSINQNVRLLKC